MHWEKASSGKLIFFFYSLVSFCFIIQTTDLVPVDLKISQENRDEFRSMLSICFESCWRMSSCQNIYFPKYKCTAGQVY